MSWTTLCKLDDVPHGSGKYVEIDGYRLAVFREGDEPRVLDDECPHAGASLWDGFVRDGCVSCIMHGWPFDLKTGQHAGGAGFEVRTYNARVARREGEPVFVEAELP